MPQRAPAVTIVAMLAIGFLYSATGTVRFYREVFARPAVSGSNATIDENLRLVNLGSGQQLREATERAGWPADADIVVMAPVSSVSGSDLTQVYYSASYLLYPRRVWLAAWCDRAAAREDCDRRNAFSDPSAAAAGHHARHVLLMGASSPFVGALNRPLSNLLTLVDLE